MGQVLLIRHGQASFGTDDYDRLSAVGQEQAVALGRALAGLTPELVVHGELRRQRETAEHAVAVAGWDAPVEVDPRWDEFEMVGSAARMARSSLTDAREFQAWYEAATDRWLAGEELEPGQEPYAEFTARTSGALAAVAEHGTAVVFTSGGPIASLSAGLLDGGQAAYRRLMPVMVNASITKILVGRRGMSLVQFNGHDHLTREQVTYR
ncbi:histidine phosphatase family protein [Nocardioides sp. Y6]|uniref:Histidine phosphatase family protein n=1 Tax=Nocardioides malaquae TaxID=2773426 RepID=A0ABR9RSX6_9ACTN|nr:histidine phosphatase family protein [Nocardioides malaquae]MBE7324633.1 histidine phosphatase family protein [Nocardioides malaquae]